MPTAINGTVTLPGLPRRVREWWSEGERERESRRGIEGGGERETLRGNERETQRERETETDRQKDSEGKRDA